MKKSFDEQKKAMIQEWEAKFLKKRLESNDWNVSATAKELSMERSFLHKKMKRHGIRKPETETA